MTSPDPSFLPDDGLSYALELVRNAPYATAELPHQLPESGAGEIQAIEMLSGHVLGEATRLGASITLAHMDPPTPWITWAMALWNASLNQNLLHESMSPFATRAEATVIDWLTPYFGMNGGHFCAGSTIANLTGIWVARDAAGARTVVTSDAAHISVDKACRLLGLDLIKVPVDELGRLDAGQVPPLNEVCLVLTAGTTATGAVDPLELAGTARWTHVDAAWAGPLRLSSAHSSVLDGVERADSVAMSAHKWLFQPKDSAMVMFRDTEAANAAIGFGSGYLAKPNIGVQGSRSAAAIPLMATLLAWGRTGVATRLEHLMAVASRLADAVEASDLLELWNRPQTAVTVFRPLRLAAEELLSRTPAAMLSSCVLGDEVWARSVAANPSVDVETVIEHVLRAASSDA
jgi:glutamate/tyrosine decarboxylase-like PLP-dependent enzyme